MTGDTGAGQVLQSAPGILLPDGELDIDTEEDLTRARSLFGEVHPQNHES
jgi:hypothetical protein